MLITRQESIFVLFINGYGADKHVSDATDTKNGVK